VTAIQRFGSALNLNLHFHILVDRNHEAPRSVTTSPRYAPGSRSASAPQVAEDGLRLRRKAEKAPRARRALGAVGGAVAPGVRGGRLGLPLRAAASPSGDRRGAGGGEPGGAGAVARAGTAAGGSRPALTGGRAETRAGSGGPGCAPGGGTGLDHGLRGAARAGCRPCGARPRGGTMSRCSTPPAVHAAYPRYNPAPLFLGIVEPT
jgi:hypothetical protein